MKPALIAHLAVCVAAAAAPLLPLSGPDAAADVASASFPGWPEAFEGQPLRRLAASEQDVRFLRDLPGRVARFECGAREVVIRWVPVVSRDVHPASVCFGALGYEITPLPGWSDPATGAWGRFAADRGDVRLVVREQVRDEHGAAWPDPTAWYWAAVLGRTTGPWWVHTVAERR